MSPGTSRSPGTEPSLSIFEKILQLRRTRGGEGPSAVSAAQLSVIADQMRERVFSPGSVLMREGEPPAATFSLVRGRVKVSRRGNMLGEVGPGAAVGMGALISRDTAGFGAVATTDVLALELDRENLVDIFDDHFPILLEAITDTARRHLGHIRRMRRSGDAPPPNLRPPSFSLPRLSLDLVGRLLFLKQPGGPFERGTLDALAEIAQRARHRKLEPGAALWREGDPARDTCLVVKGALVCSSADPDGPAPFRAERGNAMGALEAIAGLPRWHDAIAEGHVEVLKQSVDDLIDVFEDNVEMATDFLAWVSTDALNLIEKRFGPGPELLEFLTGVRSTTAA